MKTSLLASLTGLFFMVCLPVFAQSSESNGGFEVTGNMKIQNNLNVLQNVRADKNVEAKDSAFVGKYLFVNGKVGVGIATPTSLLHVNGDGKFEGDIRANKIIVQSIEVSNPTQSTPISLGENLFVNGSIGVGTSKTEGYKLSVNGKIRASDIIKVYPAGEWSDFVFEKSYKLPTLHEVEQYIQKNGHLPEIPSAAEVEKEGIDLGSMDAKLLQKIEELTLYMIELKKENERLKKEVTFLNKKIK